ncbi:MAG: SMP-30/gluconolactonase/LRE family protein [Clostridia bacterium]|nr:SMP-30/gluconolactonase/LRE family protein [Clostridia bacterium]
MIIHTPDILIPHRCRLGEGPVWDGDTDTLYYTDILAGELHSHSLTGGRGPTLQLNQQLGCFALRRQGGFVLGLSAGVYLRSADGRQVEKLPAPDWTAMVRANDGKCDLAGRFFCGTSDEVEGAAEGGLYVITPEGRCARLLSGLRCANGLAFAGSTVYFIDSPRRQVERYTFDPETLILTGGEAVIAVDPAHGLPDGMTMDEEGLLWVAHWGGGFVGRYDPRTGALLERVEVPASQTTSCCFGGSDMRTLFITTASVGREDEPHAGKVFAVRLPVAGVPSPKFGG